MKRNKDEIQYDYCARRELEKYRVAILKLGLPAHISCQLITERNKDTGEVRVRKEPVQGTYTSEHRFPGQRKLTKLEKKKMKRAKTKLKYRLQAQTKQEELRACSGYVSEPLIVSP